LFAGEDIHKKNSAVKSRAEKYRVSEENPAFPGKLALGKKPCTCACINIDVVLPLEDTRLRSCARGGDITPCDQSLIFEHLLTCSHVQQYPDVTTRDAFGC
jgi:hypothetical protein